MRSKYKVDDVLIHKKYKYIAKIVSRNSLEVHLEILVNTEAFQKSPQYWYKTMVSYKYAVLKAQGNFNPNKTIGKSELPIIVTYAPSSINKLFDKASPSWEILYGTHKK